MGVAAGDFEGNGHEDIFKTNLTNEGSNLFVNDGRGNFHDAAAEFGLVLPTFPYTGFGTEWFDYDNDGQLDLFIANGAVNRIESLRGTLPVRPARLVVSQRGRREEVSRHDRRGRARLCLA